MPRSTIISIGNELLLGKTVNTNLAWLANELAILGFPVEFSLTIKDDREAIFQAVQECWETCEIVITTGGLGPTQDDITKSVIAEFFGRELVFDENIWAQVQKRFSARHMPTPDVNRSQALVPQGFKALKNERGTAPGLFFESGDNCFFAFAGVPVEMRYVFQNHAIQILKEKYGECPAVIQSTLHTFNISESALAELLNELSIPEDVNMAWLPQTGRVDLRFYGTNPESVEQAVKSCLSLVSKYVWGRDADTPVSVLHNLLRNKGLTFSAAESCTGGMIQKMITELAGASDVFLGGAVSYSNQLKQSIGVSAETLSKFGAVSEECALEMVQGIKNLTESSTAISVTGIAGPEGGTDDKPVGTVCYGFSVLTKVWSLTQNFSGDRALIRHKASEFAILHLIHYLQGNMV
ncbi:MAG: CinA family nicotinamide mononucleotide deamidase-related protein [Candidatus Syntrophosphaera sp.]